MLINLIVFDYWFWGNCWNFESGKCRRFKLIQSQFLTEFRDVGLCENMKSSQQIFTHALAIAVKRFDWAKSFEETSHGMSCGYFTQRAFNKTINFRSSLMHFYGKTTKISWKANINLPKPRVFLKEASVKTVRCQNIFHSKIG